MQNVIQKQMQALTCYFVVPAYIQQTTNDRNTLTPKQRIALDPSCHRKNQARQPRGSGCRPRTCGEIYLTFCMMIDDGQDGDDDAPTYIWWIVKYEYGTENDINVLGYLSDKSFK